MSQAPQPPPTGPDGRPTGSRNLWTYLGVGAGIAVLAVVLFLVLRPDDDAENTADVTPSVQTTTTVETTTEAATEVTTTVQTTTEQTTTTAESPQRIVVDVVDGQPAGGIQRAEIELDSEVVFIVRADVTDEVHIHGYDLAADVAPGQPARIRFRADTPGGFEVELEGSAVRIAELTVS